MNAFYYKGCITKENVYLHIYVLIVYIKKINLDVEAFPKEQQVADPWPRSFFLETD